MLRGFKQKVGITAVPTEKKASTVGSEDRLYIDYFFFTFRLADLKKYFRYRLNMNNCHIIMVSPLCHRFNVDHCELFVHESKYFSF